MELVGLSVPLGGATAAFLSILLGLVSGQHGGPVAWCADGCGATKCPDVYNPLCASNNVTYRNDCYFTCAQCGLAGGLRLVHRGLCECADLGACQPDYNPVCGTDHNDYSNLCQLRLADSCRPDVNVTVKHVGPCMPDPADPLCQSKMVCAAMYVPVCASDGRTYGNACLLRSANVCRNPDDKADVSYSGECYAMFKTWMAIAIVSMLCLFTALLCCAFLLRRSYRDERRYEVQGGDREAL